MGQRQFKSGDTSTWADRYGNSDDGSLTISSDQTFNAANRSCSGTAAASILTVSSTTGFTAGDLILIHQTRGTGVGNWELNKVDSVGSGVLNLSYALINTYTDSGNDQAQVVELREYSSVTINSGVTWSAPAWDGNIGGIFAFVCEGAVTNNGTINLTGKGFIPGDYSGPNANGYQAEGSVGASTGRSGSANGNGGGGGDAQWNGGGGGGYAAAGDGGTGGTGSADGGLQVGTANLTTLFFGGGGGSGSGLGVSDPRGGGAGGKGGGIGLIIAKTFTNNGTILFQGNDGDSGQATSCGGGGGSAGGGLLIKGQTVSLGTNLVTGTGGVGGNGASPSGGPGGNGSTGRIHVDYSDSVTGTTNPTLDSTLENILSDTATTTSTTTTSTSSSTSTTTTSTSTTISLTTTTSTTTTSTSTTMTTTSTSTTTTSTSTTTTSTSTTTTSTSVPREFLVEMAI